MKFEKKECLDSLDLMYENPFSYILGGVIRLLLTPDFPHGAQQSVSVLIL